MIEAGLHRKHFPKYRGVFKSIPVKPLVIETGLRVSKGSVVPVIQKVSHFVVTGGGEKKAVTVGGDVWSYSDRGNNYLVAEFD